MMAVIREDVVSIGFEVERNPFAELTAGINEIKAKLGILDEMTGGLDGMSEGASTAANDVDRLNGCLGESARSNPARPLNEAGEAAGEASESVSKLASGMKSLTGHAANAAKSLGSKAWGGIKAIGKGAAVGIGAAGAALGGAAVLGVNSAADCQQALNSMQAQTGASAAEAQELKKIMSSLYVDNMGQDYGDLANSISTVKQITGTAGGELEGLTNHALLLRDTFEYDVTESARSAKMMMDQFGISGDEAYNLIAQGTQSGLNKNGDLLDTLNEYGVHFKQMGFSSTEMMNMLVNGAESGTFSVDKLGDSIKEFGIRSKDGSKASSEAYQMLGLDAKKLTSDFAEGGEKGKLAFDQVAKALAGMDDPVKQNAAGVSLFGTMWEDLGTEGVLAMSDLTGSVEGGTAALEEIGKVKYNDLKSNLGSLKRSFVDGLVNPLSSLLTPSLNAGIEELKGFVGRAKGLLEDGIQPGDMGQLAAIVGEMLSGMLTKLAGALPSLIQGGASIVSSLISGIMQNKDQIAQSVLTGISSMLMGITQVLPQLVTAGLELSGSLISGLSSQMPGIINAGMTAIQNLCSGILANAPAIIQSGISIIMQLINGLVAMAPTILTTGIQLVIMLAQGLIGAIPQLVQAIPQLVAAIITTLMSVDWLKLGLDVISGIGNGLVQGIKGLFSKGKDAGKEVGDGVAAGVNESTSQLTSAADSTTAAAADSFKPDTVQLSDYGMQMPAAVASGIQSGTAEVETAALGLGCSASDTLNAALAGTADGAQPALTDLSASLDGTMAGMNLLTDTQMAQMDTTVQTGFQGMVTEAQGFSGDFKGEIDQTDLYQSGVSIMQGLDNGLNSMRGAVIGTARGIAGDVKDTVNGSLDIHSPSGVMEDSGEDTALGLVKGIKNMEGKVVKTARGISEVTAGNLSPMRSRYGPENSAVTNSHTSNEVNTYSPVFHLALNGASATDSNERKVKRWVREAMKEAVEGMGRTNPRLQEV